MKALIYLTQRTVVNNLKRALKKPATLLALIFGIAYGIFLIAVLGTLAVSVRIDSAPGLVILVTVWTIYITVGNFMLREKESCSDRLILSLSFLLLSVPNLF